MADMVQTKKKIALLHRHPASMIKETNAAFPYLKEKGIDVLTFKTFPRTSKWKKFFKSILWIFYAPFLVIGKGYDVIYCDDSYPFYPILIRLFSPKSRIVLRLGDLHLMYYTSGIMYKILHLIEIIGWKLSDEIICISQAMNDYVGKECGKDVWTVLDPVDPSDFPIRKTNHGTVMFHGVITKNKNIDVLLKAAEKLPKINFIILGTGPDKERLEKIAPHNVFFKGWIPFKNVYKYISTCAIGVALRSDNPGNEYVVTSPFLQYGIMAKPCLVTRRKVFGDYEWQFLGADEMVEKLEKLFMRPTEEGEKLREYILENHDAKKISEEIWTILSA